MKRILKNIRLWMPTVVLLMIAAFTIVRVQTIQTALIVQIKNKQSKEVYQADRENFIRELNRIHESLDRIEEKIDNVSIAKY